MQAIILAAGMGKRLKDLTENNTKCMIKVNGVTLIERLLRQIEALSLSKIIIVIGYEGQKLADYIGTLPGLTTKIEFVENDIYNQTNNIYSLYLAREHLLKDDTLLFESDVIMEDSILTDLVHDSRESLAIVDKFESWMDGTVVELGENDEILDFIPKKKFVFEDSFKYYKTVNIYKFSRQFSTTHYVPFLEAYIKALGTNEYYEQVLKVIATLEDSEIRGKRLNGQKWYEIDDIQDLDIAESIFPADEKEGISNIHKRYGGYWRYPKLVDYCYLVNPYFPPNRLMQEMKANFETLLCQYPSGQRVNDLLAAKNFGVKQEYIAVGNGAAELIKVVMDNTEGTVGFIKPTFEEYPNRYQAVQSCFFVSEKEGFRYDAEDIISFFDEKEIATLVLINPDNPSGNYISRQGIDSLLKWTKEKRIQFLLDESFIDFSEEGCTYIKNDILENNPQLIVIKSISKSYGIPGVRLGVLASSDKDLLIRIRKEVSIWNINSFGEYFMQIYEKYSKEYRLALEKLKMARKIFIEELEDISYLNVFPTQANYVMCQLMNGVRADKLEEFLYTEHSILIKSLNDKIRDDKQYIRLAIRDEKDNQRLLDALKGYEQLEKGGRK